MAATQPQACPHVSSVIGIILLGQLCPKGDNIVKVDTFTALTLASIPLGSQVHKAAGALLDMLLTAGVLLYLVGLWVVLRVCWHGWSDVTALFSPKPVRRSRGGSHKRN